MRVAYARFGSTRTAFTLIELLVVISIIALLVALILPSLARAKEAAARAKCLSGARQVMLASRSYQDDNRTYFVSNHVSGAGAQKVLVDGGYIQSPIFTNQGCPYGPANYSEAGAGASYYYDDGSTGGSVAFGLNWELQTGSGWANYSSGSGSYTSYGPFHERRKRLQRQPTLVIVSSCSIDIGASLNTTNAYPGGGLQHTLGITSWYFGGTPIHGRHYGEGLPMTFYDGHGAFVPTASIYPYYYTAPPYTTVEWSFNIMYHSAGMDD